jgi:hypothetical protein
VLTLYFVAGALITPKIDCWLVLRTVVPAPHTEEHDIHRGNSRVFEMKRQPHTHTYFHFSTLVTLYCCGISLHRWTVYHFLNSNTVLCKLVSAFVSIVSKDEQYLSYRAADPGKQCHCHDILSVAGSLSTVCCLLQFYGVVQISCCLLLSWL